MNKYKVIWDDDLELFQVLYIESPICIMIHPDFQSLPLLRSQWMINQDHSCGAGFYPILPPIMSFISESWNQNHSMDYRYYVHNQEFNNKEIKRLVFDLVDQLNKIPNQFISRFENLLE
jgi:hypothetical protein